LILGVVTADGREAIIEVSVRGPAARERIVTAVIDTGFDGWLTLPSALAADLGLVRVGWQRAVLADGNEVQLDVFEATVVWDGALVPVLAATAEGGPLVGMTLLRGCELNVQVIEGGSVRITAIRSVPA
jgi:clan AA aspartic protease